MAAADVVAASSALSGGAGNNGLPVLASTARYCFDDYEVRPEIGQLLHKGHRVRVQDLPFRMLLVLLGSPGEVVSREELRARLWDENTFVEFDNNLRVAAAKLREALRDNASEPRYLETVARRGYRFLAPVETAREESSSVTDRTSPMGVLPQVEAPSPGLLLVPPVASQKAELSRGASRLWLRVASVALLVIVCLLAWFALRRHNNVVLATREMVAIGSLRNETGDPALDEALSLSFRIKMEESPFLHLISTDQFERSLRNLQSASSQPIPAEAIERQACIANGAKVLLNGKLSRAGNAFQVQLKATQCDSGRLLATTESTAPTEQHLLINLGAAANTLRLKLGETPEMLGRFNVPVTQATTSSLAALRAYRDGERKRMAGHDLEAREDLKLAVDLDPQFALAYLQLGRSFSNYGERALSRDYYQKAFDLRDRTTDREKLYIASSYYSYATGEHDRAMGAYKLWSTLYPNDVVPANNLATEYVRMGDGPNAVVAARRAIELEPGLPVPYGVLAIALEISGDLGTLSVLCNDPQHANNAVTSYHIACFELAVLQNDKSRQQAELKAASGKPVEVPLLDAAAENQAYAGHLNAATSLFQQAVGSARKQGLSELAGIIQLNEAGVLAELGRTASAPALLRDTLSQPNPGAEVEAGAALDWAILGDQAKASEAVRIAQQQAPRDTLLNLGELSVASAIADMKTGHVREAVAHLEAERPYDFNSTMELIPIYYRARALSENGNRSGAIDEYQNLLTHSFHHPRSVYIPLAKLELAKLYEAIGQNHESQSFTCQLQEDWKSADKDFARAHELARTVCASAR